MLCVQTLMYKRLEERGQERKVVSLPGITGAAQPAGCFGNPGQSAEAGRGRVLQGFQRG